MTAAPAAASAACAWCEQDLPKLAREKSLASGDSGDAVKKVHEHLKKFGMTIELGDWKAKDHKFEESADVSKGTWGKPTIRAVRMFALHPVVGKEPARVVVSDGKTIAADLVPKFQEWCKGGVVSPQHYWELKGLHIKDGDLDAAGAAAAPEKQTVLHDFIVQIEKDLVKTGFAAHDDALCAIGTEHKPTGAFVRVKPNAAGKHEDKTLSDMPYVIAKFQRQARWLWRMRSDGSHRSDAGASDPSTYGGSPGGEVDEATAKVLHQWSEGGLHMVIKKFPLEDLNWPPDGGSAIVNSPAGTPAQLRKDAHESWLKAAREVKHLNGTLEGPYASSPRGWSGGKAKTSTASSYSWHYSGLAIDVSQVPQMGDASISEHGPYGLEKDGTLFRLWCWVVPQPAKPEKPADDYKPGDRIQYRNRNIKYKHDRAAAATEKVKAADPADPRTLYFVTSTSNASGTDKKEVAAREGWYIDISAIMEANRLMRIPRHANWLFDKKAWEWWHYQYQPAPPPGAADDLTFGEFLQLFGVHECRLRQLKDGWSTHEDIDHTPG